MNFAVIFRNVTTDFKSCSHISKCDRKMLKVAVIIQNLTACFKICSHVTATFNILQS